MSKRDANHGAAAAFLANLGTTLAGLAAEGLAIPPGLVTVLKALACGLIDLSDRSRQQIAEDKSRLTAIMEKHTRLTVGALEEALLQFAEDRPEHHDNLSELQEALKDPKHINQKQRLLEVAKKALPDSKSARDPLVVGEMLIQKDTVNVDASLTQVQADRHESLRIEHSTVFVIHGSYAGKDIDKLAAFVEKVISERDRGYGEGR